MPVRPVNGKFETVLDFIEREIGIKLPDTAFNTVGSYVESCLPRFDGSLESFLQAVQRDGQERAAFLDAVTINETYFFREARHFRALEASVFPALAEEKTQRVRIWSASCSTGEEAIALAALASKFWDIRAITVYASDINPLVLERARQARYGSNSFREDGKEFHYLLEPFFDKDGVGYAIRPDILRSIQVRQINLVSETYEGIPEELDLIFLRNTLIYMKPETRNRIVSRLTEILAPRGYLFFSSSEIPHHSHPDLLLVEQEGSFFFRKKTREEKANGIIPTQAVIREPDGGMERSDRTDRIVRDSFPRERPQAEKIMEYASMRLNNPMFEENDPAFAAAIVFLKAVYMLNAGKSGKALQIAGEAGRLWGENELTAYLRGMVCTEGNRTEEALNEFDKALFANSGFWPARFRKALLLKDASPGAARREFVRCASDIRGYIGAGRFSYQFILEGFNAKYFLRICEGWIQKLEKEGGAHGAE